MTKSATSPALALAAVAALAACAEHAPQTAGGAAAWTGGPITDEATFRREIVGRPLTATNDRDRFTVIVDDAGGLTSTVTALGTGETRDGVAGVWKWRDGRYCRELTEATGAAPVSECQTVSKTGDAATFTSPDGRATRWTVGPA